MLEVEVADEELAIYIALRDLNDRFSALPGGYAEDHGTVGDAVHAIQKAILARPIRRAFAAAVLDEEREREAAQQAVTDEAAPPITPEGATVARLENGAWVVSTHGDAHSYMTPTPAPRGGRAKAAT